MRPHATLLMLLGSQCQLALALAMCSRPAGAVQAARSTGLVMSSSAPTPRATPNSNPGSDWGGLPAAMKASKCGAINHQITKQPDVDSVLKLVASKSKDLNGVNVATALHRLAGHTKRNRADRDR